MVTIHNYLLFGNSKGRSASAYRNKQKAVYFYRLTRQMIITRKMWKVSNVSTYELQTFAELQTSDFEVCSM